MCILIHTSCWATYGYNLAWLWESAEFKKLALVHPGYHRGQACKVPLVRFYFCGCFSSLDRNCCILASIEGQFFSKHRGAIFVTTNVRFLSVSCERLPTNE